jgi:hypothetical protein
MKKTKLQHQITQQTRKDTLTADKWLAEQGIDTNIVSTTHIRLIQAQRQAHQLLTHNRNLLTTEQQRTLRNFQQLMAHKRTRDRLKPNSANAVLNISSKINRQLFKQHRQLNKAPA